MANYSYEVGGIYFGKINEYRGVNGFLDCGLKVIQSSPLLADYWLVVSVKDSNERGLATVEGVTTFASIFTLTAFPVISRMREFLIYEVYPNGGGEMISDGSVYSKYTSFAHGGFLWKAKSGEAGERSAKSMLCHLVEKALYDANENYSFN